MVQRKRGFVLIATLLIMVVVAIVVFGTLFTTLIDRQVAAYQKGAHAAHYVAQSGLKRYQTFLFRTLVEHYAEAEGECGVDPLADEVAAEVAEVLEGADADGWFAFPTAHSSGGLARYRLERELVDGYLVVTSEGQYGNAQSTVRLVMAIGEGPVSVWDNAVFAVGDGEDDPISGPSMIYGSVQVAVTGGLLLADDAGAQGATAVYANYHGTPGQGDTAVTTELARVILGPDEGWDDVETQVPDLCTKVKVEAGDLALEDGAGVGTDTHPIQSVHLGPAGRVLESTVGGGETEVGNHHDSDRIFVRDPEGDGMQLPYGFHLRLPRLHHEFPREGYPPGAHFEGGEPLLLPGYVGGEESSSDACAWLLDDGVVRLPPPDLEAAIDAYGYRNRQDDAYYLTCFAGIDEIDDALVEDVVWPQEEPGDRAHITWVIPDASSPYLRIHGWVNTGSYPVALGPLPVESEPGGEEGNGAVGASRLPMRYQGIGVLRTGECLAAGEWSCAEPDPDVSISVLGELFPAGGFASRHALGLVSTGDIYVENAPGEVTAVLAYAENKVQLASSSLVAGAVAGKRVEFEGMARVAYHPEVRSVAEELCLPGSHCLASHAGDPALGPPPSRTLTEVTYERR